MADPSMAVGAASFKSWSLRFFKACSRLVVKGDEGPAEPPERLNVEPQYVAKGMGFVTKPESAR